MFKPGDGRQHWGGSLLVLVRPVLEFFTASLAPFAEISLEIFPAFWCLVSYPQMRILGELMSLSKFKRR
jgi:hypothetical protein